MRDDLMTKVQKDELKKFRKAAKAIIIEDKKLLRELAKHWDD